MIQINLAGAQARQSYRVQATPEEDDGEHEAGHASDVPRAWDDEAASLELSFPPGGVSRIAVMTAANSLIDRAWVLLADGADGGLTVQLTLARGESSPDMTASTSRPALELLADELIREAHWEATQTQLRRRHQPRIAAITARAFGVGTRVGTRVGTPVASPEGTG